MYKYLGFVMQNTIQKIDNADLKSKKRENNQINKIIY